MEQKLLIKNEDETRESESSLLLLWLMDWSWKGAPLLIRGTPLIWLFDSSEVMKLYVEISILIGFLLY